MSLRLPGGGLMIGLGLLGLWMCGCRSTELSPEFIEAVNQQALTALKSVASASEEPPCVRGRALRGLAQAPDRAFLPWARQALHDPEPLIRCQAVLMLGRRRDLISIHTIQRLLNDEQTAVRRAAALSLKICNQDPYYDGLIQFVGDSDVLYHCPEMSRWLIDFAQIVSRREVPDAMDPDSSIDDGLLGYALRSAEIKLGDRRALNQVIRQASFGSRRAQIDALRLLGQTADPQVTGVLLERLENCSYPEGQLTAAQSLTRFGSNAGLPLARRWITGNDPDSEPALQVIACAVCGAVGEPEDLQELAELINRTEHLVVRVACAAAILELIHRRSGGLASA